MTLVGFSMGSSGAINTEKSLDEIIADRRKEQAKASTGRNTKNTKNNGNNNNKKNATADRSIATGKAKRAAATRAKRGLSGDNKPSPMEVEREVYRQSRKTSETKKKTEQKASNGRLPPNSSLRGKKKKKNENDPPGAMYGIMPHKKQIEAAINGMKAARCPVPAGHQLIMQFAPLIVAAAPAAATTGKGRGKRGGGDGRGQANNNNNKKNNNNDNDNDNNKKNGGGRGGRGGRGGKK